MKSGKMLFFDVDGTLFDSHSHIVHDSTKEALKLLKENGHRIVISTGRGLESLERAGFTDIADWDGFVCSNGQIVYDSEKNKIAASFMDRDTFDRFTETVDRLGMMYVYVTEHTCYANKEPDDRMKFVYKFFGEPMPDVKAYDEDDVITCMTFGDVDYDYSDFKELDGIDAMPGRIGYTDIVPKGFGKEDGVRKLIDYYDINESYSFGDGLNDIGMLDACTVGIAMGNGAEEVKESADYVTDPISEDGLYNACKHFNLI